MPYSYLCHRGLNSKLHAPLPYAISSKSLMAQALQTPSLFSASPPTDLPPETLDHLLSLPTLFEPLSPSLAALHLARVRLLLSIPTSPFTGNVGEWWCHHCGGLREGLGGALQRKRVGPMATDGSDCGTGGLKRKKAECSQCGASYTRPKSDRKALMAFVPARTRSRRANFNPEVIMSTDLISPLVATSTDQVIEQSSSSSSPTKPRPTLLSTPSLTYIPSSAPNPPTYPAPIARCSVSSPTSKGKGAGKTRKRSGLAKLLAENRERVEKENDLGSGSWGLE